MLRRTAQLGFLTVLAAVTLAPAGECDRVAMLARSGEDKKPYAPDAKLDPLVFFDELVERYQGLSEYRDTSQLLQITRRPGKEDQRMETRIQCEIREDELRVTTPSEQLRRDFGLEVPFKRTEAMKLMQRRYQLWLAPHMALRFSENPLKDLGEGVEEGFTPCVAERVVHNKRLMYHIELRSGDGLSGMSEAEYDLYVNPESMLIERVESIRHMPDGSDFITTLEITPDFEGAEPAESVVS